jgi:hypothetical protein
MVYALSKLCMDSSDNLHESIVSASLHGEAPFAKTVRRMIRGGENTFDPDIFVNTMRERFKFTLVHVPAMKFRQTVLHAGHLRDTGRCGYDDFIGLLFYFVANYHCPGTEFHGAHKTFEAPLFDMEPFYNVF